MEIARGTRFIPSPLAIFNGREVIYLAKIAKNNAIEINYFFVSFAILA